jgi:hypothetical protein
MRPDQKNKQLFSFSLILQGLAGLVVAKKQVAGLGPVWSGSQVENVDSEALAAESVAGLQPHLGRFALSVGFRPVGDVSLEFRDGEAVGGV